MKASYICKAACLLSLSRAFKVPFVRHRAIVPFTCCFTNSVALRMSQDPSSIDNVEDVSTTKEVTNVENLSLNASLDTEKGAYPIDLPSPVLLSSSVVIAIGSIGTAFDVAGGNSSITKLAIVIIGLPLCLFLFYASVKKGIAETEEDDARFNGSY